MQVIRYEDKYRKDWDEFVSSSKNGTFLFLRGFMDYHKARFTDCSLLFEDKGKITGSFPANIVEDTVFSHGGLTYGGLMTTRKTSYLEVRQMLDITTDFYKRTFQARKMLYKPVPPIYHLYPAEEDLYYLFSHKGKLVTRAISSVIDLRSPLPFSTLRKRHVSKALRNGLVTCETQDEEAWSSYWTILTDVLRKRHHLSPVHSIEEITLLRTRFPDKIKLFVTKKEGRIIAGCVVFITTQVLHIQYIAANDEGCSMGALDLLFHDILTSTYSKEAAYLDFGISTENDGQELNEGLLFQKEGFGGRAVCYDRYEIDF